MDSNNFGLISLSTEEMQEVNGGSAFWNDFWTGVLNDLTTYWWPWAGEPRVSATPRRSSPRALRACAA